MYHYINSIILLNPLNITFLLGNTCIIIFVNLHLVPIKGYMSEAVVYYYSEENLTVIHKLKKRACHFSTIRILCQTSVLANTPRNSIERFKMPMMEI